MYVAAQWIFATRASGRLRFGHGITAFAGECVGDDSSANPKANRKGIEIHKYPKITF
jgi:hypothetical protein